MSSKVAMHVNYLTVNCQLYKQETLEIFHNESTKKGRQLKSCKQRG